MLIEIEIDERRAELRNAVDAEERRQIMGELETLEAELASIVAQQSEDLDGAPPI